MLLVKWLFEAIYERRNVVTFCRQYYGKNAHELLAAHGYASQFIKSEKLPGGWVVVVMDRVVGAESLTLIQPSAAV